MKEFCKIALSCLAFTSCTSDAPDVGQTADEVTCPVPTLDTTRSLLVTDPTALANFSFQRVMNAIATSGHATNTSLQMWQAWMATFANCSDPKIDPNGYGITCPRVESTLGSINPFLPTGPRFVPVALANRFDLAPRSGADCGEYRIVFALSGGNGRGFIIFEGRLPNPTPAVGISGCGPVADFWAQLSTDPSATSRAAKLDSFYFTGLTGFEPVVAATHYGLANSLTTSARNKGQIRTNMFIQFQQWNLREFQLTKPCAASASCALSVEHVAAKVNPANELFTGTHANAPTFQSAFLSQIPALSAGTAATIGMTNGNNFNEFESVSSGSTDVLYANFTQPSFQSQIAARITNPSLTVANILDRATTQTCAGCHQLSSGTHAQLGAGVVWPASLGFVQINEQSQLSQALTTAFLPHRSTVLTSFLQAQCNGTAIVDNGTTLSGGPTDAAN
ncbi:MAG TPA: hypothetical protein VHN14_35150 [Kofleriaceae bacterium]|jgi:hypothetical protein|nr:hypothetical protein [Kofleriaceae bacterium]